MDKSKRQLTLVFCVHVAAGVVLAVLPSRAIAGAKDQLRELQVVLAQRDCYDGTIDGAWGRMTEAAVAAFSIASGTAIRPPIDAATLAAVKASAARCRRPSAMAPVASPSRPEFTAGKPETIYTRAQLVAHGLHYWPDGNIGVVPKGNGQADFYAANSIRSAHTIGTLAAPATRTERTALDIRGIGSQYAYRAGGPVYRDDSTGMLLMLYHAERHFGGNGAVFYSEIGMAVSTDDGRSFRDLGIVLSPHVSPSPRFTVEMGGGTFTVHDGYFYVFFRDAMSRDAGVNLAVARAPVGEVVRAAKQGKAPLFRKYYGGAFSEPGRAGRATALEAGNPLNRWMSVTYNTALDRFVLVISKTQGSALSTLYLTTSRDGIKWSVRVPILTRRAELFYPSIIGATGSGLTTGDKFYVYFTASENWRNRWADADLKRVAVGLTGRMIEPPHQWEFNTPGDAEGWTPLNQIAAFDVAKGALTVTPSGHDPYMSSPNLSVDTSRYSRIEVRLKTQTFAVGQFFFTSGADQGFSEANSKRFQITPGPFRVYTVDMGQLPGWRGTLSKLRFDPTDQTAPVTIDYIRLLP